MDASDSQTDASSSPNSSSSSAIQVAAGLVFRNGKLLITQRFPDSHLGGLWEFPGGKVEPGETFTDCLHRELMEELNIKVTVGKLYESVEHAYPEKTVHLKFYVCQWLENEPEPIGCPALHWIASDQLADFEFPSADARLLDKLRQSWPAPIS